MSEKRVGPRITGVVKSQLKNSAHLQGQWWEGLGEGLVCAKWSVHGRRGHWHLYHDCRGAVRGKRARGLHTCKIFLTLFLPSSKKASGWMSHWWTARATPGQMWTCTKSELQGTTLSVSDPGWGCFPTLQQEVYRAQRSHQYSILPAFLSLPWWDHLLVPMEGLRTMGMG